MSLNQKYYQEVAERLIMEEFPEEWEVAPQFCGTVIDPKAVFGHWLEPIPAKIKHLEILQDEISMYYKVMAPAVLTLHVRKHYGTLYKDLKEILRQEYLPGLASRIDWSVADRFDRAGFTVCYDKQTDRLQVKVGESAIEL